VSVRWLFTFVLVIALLPRAALAGTVHVWHSYRGDEEVALLEAARAYETAHAQAIDVLALPNDAYSAKLGAAVPRGHGPDLFVEAHERLGFYLREGIVGPIGDGFPEADVPDQDPAAVRALTIEGVRYGAPLTAKALVLFVSDALMKNAPATMEELARTKLADGSYPLAYEEQQAFFHAPFMHAFGARMLDDQGRFAFVGPEAARSVEFVRSLAQGHAMPDEPSGALVKQLFVTRKVAAVISGPWFAAELREEAKDLAYHVEPLPRIASAPEPMRSYVTIEAICATPQASAEARAFARWLAGPEAAVIRAKKGREAVTALKAWDDPRVAGDAELASFREAARSGVVMPATPAMRASWVPANQAILKTLRGDLSASDALVEAKHRWEDTMRPPPPPASPTPALVLVGLGLAALAALAVRRAREPRFRAELSASLPAYRYVAHAVVVVLVLVVLPLAAGALTSMFAGTRRDPTYVGLANYAAILTARGGDLLGHGSFYLTLLVTAIWTVANVSLHVATGVMLGAALSRRWMKIRSIYRIVLILPWAVPSYVTALAWKGMFHRQFGAINAILGWVGVEPVSWFSHFSTAFAANVATNVWLGFPFMMVVTLGALTSIPKDVLEAAEVDGASKWQRFRLVTLPLLQPALLPAVVLGAVWTFNMFNVVFLVSGGEPDGATDILVSEAYRWAFTKDAQYGYAAAYAVLIFGLLAVGSRVAARRFGREEAV
jgi:arabinogalactan oligomer/maltooligosaccharide transport system permease protein